MSQDLNDDDKKSFKENSSNLEKLGTELGKTRFSYKVEQKATKEYWQKRITDFKGYSEKSLQYYNQVYAMMCLADKKEAQMFLLRLSKFRQLGLGLIEIMEKIRENPTIIDSKNKQQSLWSKKIKEQITEHSNVCLRHEMDMSSTFREFYEKHLEKLSTR